jgi:IS1 family transposase
MKDYEDDGPWMWVAFAPSCRLIVDFIIGPRKQYVADELLDIVSKRLSKSILLFVTDGLKFYAEAILKNRKTIGFSKKVEWLINHMKLYCTHFSATRCYVMNCANAALSIWGNPTRMCISSDVGVQSFWDNVKTSENPIRIIY